MKIKMLVSLAGNEYSLSPGDERDFTQAEAIRLIDAGFAVPVAEAKTERAVAQPATEKRKKGKADVVSDSSGNSGDE